MQFKEVNNLYSTTKIRDGIIRTKNKSDQLDSCTVVLTHIPAIDIEAYDLIELTNEDNQKEYYLVANYNKVYVTFEAPFLYDYTVDLMSFTKWLETIQLPNMTITNIGQNRKIRDYIEGIINYYVVPQIDSAYVTGATFNLDGRFNNISPEMSFSQPTAREYLDWMVANYGCIIKADYDATNKKIVISTLDLNSTEGAMPTTYMKGIVESQAAEEYVTQLDHTISDVIGQKTVTEYLNLKSDGYVFNSDNAVAILSYKPYDITKVVLKSTMTMHRKVTILNPVGEGNVPTEPSTTVVYNDDVSIADLDLTKYFKPERVFNTLELVNRNSGNNTYTTIRGLKYQSAEDTKETIGIGTEVKNNTLYWSRGNTTIQNFHQTESYKNFFGNITSETAIEFAVIEAWLNQNWTNSYDATKGWQVEEEYSIPSYDWHGLIIEVTYVPYISTRLQLPQKEPYRHLITMQDNSTNTLTELASYIRQSLEKNSKLGNKAKVFTARSIVTTDHQPKYSIGQYWIDENQDKYILTNLEYETKQNSIIYKGTLTKNYANRYINTIINREKRYYALPDAGEAVTRNEVFKTKVKISLSDTAPGDTKYKILRPAAYMMFNSGKGEMGIAVGGITATTSYGDNVLVFNATFYDNVVYATEVGDSSDYTNGSGYAMVVNKYVNEDGEFEWLSFSFKITTSEYNYQSITSAEIDRLRTYEGSFADPTLTTSRTKHFLKDSRERVSITEECIYTTEDSKITVGKIAETVKHYGIHTPTLKVGFMYNNSNYSTTCTLREFVENDWVATLSSLYAFAVGQEVTLTVSDKETNEVYLTINKYTLNKYLNYTIQEA